MIISVNEVKSYLKIESPEEDTLIQTLITASLSYAETYLNRPILDANMTPETRWNVPECIRIAVYLLVSHWYENRTPIGKLTKEMDFAISAILSPYRFRNV